MISTQKISYQLELGHKQVPNSATRVVVLTGDGTKVFLRHRVRPRGTWELGHAMQQDMQCMPWIISLILSLIIPNVNTLLREKQLLNASLEPTSGLHARTSRNSRWQTAQFYPVHCIATTER